jgi:carbon-monoxide dehydrogenase medium subunit
MLPEFELLLPRSLAEALDMLAEAGPEARPVAGGTNLIVDLRAGRHAPPVLVDVSRLEELRGIRRENGQVVVGGATSLADVLASPLIAQYGRPLHEAARVFANPLVRNRATVGGNLADASPAADTAPALLALGAMVELVSLRGTRCLPLEEFFTGVRQTRMWPGELLTAIRWPVPARFAGEAGAEAGAEARPGPRSAGGFYKIGLRKADAVAVLSAAVQVEFDRSGRCAGARIALGAVAPTPRRVPEAENMLVGQVLARELLAEAAAKCADAASPIDDVRGSAAYRRRVTAVIVRRLLERAALSMAAEAGGPRSAA